MLPGGTSGSSECGNISSRLHGCNLPVFSLSSITVVQSYFVHWAGVESLVVRDRSRGSGTGGNVAAMKEWDLASLLQERLRAKTTGPWRALEPTATSGAAPSYGSQETPTALVHALPEGTGSETLAPLGKVHLKEQQVAETSSSQPFTPQQSVTASRLGVHHEAANDSPRLEKTSNHEGTSQGFLLESILHLTSTGSTPVPQTGLWSLPSWISQTKTDFLDHSQGADQQQTQTRWAQRPTPTPGAPQTVLFSRVYPASPRSDDKNLTPAASAVNSAESPNFVPTASAASPSTPKPSLDSTPTPLPATSLHPSSFITSLHPPARSTGVSTQTSTLESGSPSTTPGNQPPTPPALPALPSPSPISSPPHTALLQPFSSPSPPFSSLKPPSGSRRYRSSVRARTSPSFSTPSAQPPTTTSVTTPALTPSLLSADSISPTSGSTSSPPGPSPVPSRSLSQPSTSSSSSVSQQLPKDHGSLIQDPTAPSESQANLSTPTPPMTVQPNPEPYPNFDSHLKANINNIKPHPPDTDNEAEPPTDPARTPGKEGKFPDIIPRHSAWELGMLLGSSAGLGMVLVVGLRYVYRQACGKRTEVTLNDREREYARGERGLIHVQECGDLVRVRRIRDNSFVFLAEYDILTPPGD